MKLVSFPGSGANTARHFTVSDGCAAAGSLVPSPELLELAGKENRGVVLVGGVGGTRVAPSPAGSIVAARLVVVVNRLTE